MCEIDGWFIVIGLIIFVIIGVSMERLSAQEMKNPELWGVYYNSETKTFIVLCNPEGNDNQCLRKRDEADIEVGSYVAREHWADTVIVKFGDKVYKFDVLTGGLFFKSDDKEPIVFYKEKMTIKEFLKNKL